MWAYGHHFRVDSVDCGKQTCDCGMSIAYDETSHASSRDMNLIARELDYVGTIQETIQLDYRFFK